MDLHETPPFKYFIQCRDMKEVQSFVVKDHYEFFDQVQRYVYRFGPIDLLYREQ